jgi:hypothetical protein
MWVHGIKLLPLFINSVYHAGEVLQVFVPTSNHYLGVC